MDSKTKNIINWVLTALVAALFLFSCSGKLMANPEALAMAEKFGISADAFRNLGIVELLSVVLFIYPRTGVLGSLLLIAYMGGAIATHMEHGDPVMTPIIISAFVWIVAVVRFPELTSRIMNNN